METAMTLTLAERTEALNASISRVKNAMEIGQNCLEPYQITRAEQDIEKLSARLGVGAGLTVAALIGGTGSGKSSTFNALTGLEFADAGDIRPMTQEAASCVWNADATALLDMLEVRPSRRINHDSLLTDIDEDYDGLVLLDLPDHDSIQVGHSALVDKMLPLVDILIWVLDPQKYADYLIHESYISQLRRRQDHMIVLLNQIDTVLPEQRDALIADVKQKLHDDGIDDVVVYPVSALEGTGLDVVHERLKEAVAATTANVSTAEAELDAIRLRLKEGVGASECDINDDVIEDTVNQIARSIGVPAVVDSLRHAGTTIRPTAIARPEKPAPALMSATRDKWMSQVKEGLPERWRDTLEESVGNSEVLRRNVATGLDSLPVPKVPTGLPRFIEIAGILLGILALLQLVISWPIPSLIVRIIVAIVGVGVAIALRPFTRRLQAKLAQRLSKRFDEQARLVIRQIVRDTLVKPSADILDTHRKVRQELSVSA